jgi:hypothetical protein
MNKFLELFTVPIAAGGQSRFELAGDYFEIIESQYPVTVLLEDRNGAQIGRMGGAEASYFLRDTPFKAITITSAQAQTVRIAFGSGEAGTRRTSGVVQVVDGNRSRTIAGGSFMWRPTSLGANFNHAQLWNPPGSGKNIVIDAFFLTSSLAGALSVCRNAAQIANAAPNPVQNALLNGGGAAVAVPRTESMAALTLSSCLGTALVQANSSFDFSSVLKRPVIVPPGAGLVFLSEVAGSTLSGSVSFFEETI